MFFDELLRFEKFLPRVRHFQRLWPGWGGVGVCRLLLRLLLPLLLLLLLRPLFAVPSFDTITVMGAEVGQVSLLIPRFDTEVGQVSVLIPRDFFFPFLSFRRGKFTFDRLDGCTMVEG